MRQPSMRVAVGATGRVGATKLMAALLVAAVALLVLAAPGARPALAQVQPGEASVTSKDPNSITFAQRVTAPGGLKSARFEYHVVNPDGDVGGSNDVQVAPGNEVDLRYSLDTRNAQRYIPVGSQFRYTWALTLNDGTTFRTQEQQYLFLDGRYQWRSRTDGPVTVYWYGSNDNAADVTLRSTKASLEETSALLQTTVPYPMRVMLYASEDDGKLAMRPTSPTFDAQVHTGGQRVAPDLLFVFDLRVDVIRHETAHVVTHVAGDGPFVSLPSWLDEGTAVYMQPDPGGYKPAIDAAIRGDHTLTLRSMQTGASKPGEVDIYYGEAWSTVDFMVNQFGRDKFAELYRTIHQGVRVDDALGIVYGLNQDSLYNAWRQAKGLKPVEASGPVVPTTGPASEATRAPLAIPTSLAGGQSSSGGSSGAATAQPASGGQAATKDEGVSNRSTALAVLAVTVLIALGLGGGGFALLRRRGSGDGPRQ